MAETIKTTKKTVKKASSSSKSLLVEKWLKAYLKVRHGKSEDRNNNKEELRVLESELLKQL